MIDTDLQPFFVWFSTPIVSGDTHGTKADGRNGSVVFTDLTSRVNHRVQDMSESHGPCAAGKMVQHYELYISREVNSLVTGLMAANTADNFITNGVDL